MKPKIALKTVLTLSLFLLILPTLSFAGQFKVTRVYDGDTVEAMALEVEGGP